MKISVLPEGLIALRQELKYHPTIKAALADAPDMASWLEMLCTELDVVVDGYYTNEDYKVLCDMLLKKLYSKRTILVIP